MYSFKSLQNFVDLDSVWSIPQEISKKVFSPPHQEESEIKTMFKPFLIDTPTCRIRKFHPFHESIAHIVNKVKPFKCPSMVLLTYDIMNELHINWTAAKLPPYIGTVAFCTYIPVYRPKDKHTHKNFAEYLKESSPFYTSVKVNTDFVKVKCYNKIKQVLYVNFHAFIPRNVSLDTLRHDRYIKHVSDNHISERLNVIILGIDTVSRNTFLRQMNKTREYIKDKLGSIKMIGYNKVGDNTFPNLIPLLLGKHIRELEWNKSMTFDRFNFTWDQFSKKGYRTLFSEDRTNIGTFQMGKMGFTKPPTDNYDRPLMLAMEKEKQLWFEHNNCFLNKHPSELMLAYLHKFIHASRNTLYFAFTWMNTVAHDKFNGPMTVDNQFYRFFKQCYEGGLLNNTVLFFLSDHGLRFGASDFRQTDIGRYETNLPFMYVYVPTWLRNKYSHIERSLQINKNRLSTPFDVHETLNDILYFNGQPQLTDQTARGISLFRSIPANRTCDSAGIPDIYCSCLERQPILLTDPLVVNTSNIILKEIQHLLKPYSEICENLTIRTVDAAAYLLESQNNKQTDNKLKDKASLLQVTITATPGEGKFDAIFEIRENDVKLVSDINRINAYGNQSYCIKDFIMKNYCVCRK